MYKIKYTNRMQHDVKIMVKRGKDITKLIRVLDIIASGQVLPEKNRDHQLTGQLCDFRECHIEPDWLLIYQIKNSELVVVATATGSHSDLF